MCMYLSVCIASRYASQNSWEENISQVLLSVLAQVMTNQFSQVGQCMYVSVLHVCVCICQYLLASEEEFINT